MGGLDLFGCLWLFFVYSFLGWIAETCFCVLKYRKFMNRGMLNSPLCIVYGIAAVIITIGFPELFDEIPILFLGCAGVSTLLEWFTAKILEKLDHKKWWDYSNKPFNLHGYVCLKFSIYWGLACTFIMDVIHPIIYKGITMIPHILGVVLLCIIMSAFAVDCGVTVTTILKFNKRLKVMDEMAAKIHKLSDEIGENIYENVTTAVEKSEEFQETHEKLLTKISDTKENLMDLPSTAKEKISSTAASAREKLSESAENINVKEKIATYKETREAARLEKQRDKEELERRYKELFAEKNFGFKRLMKAFPDMTSREQNESLEKYKKYFNIRKPDHKKDE